MNIGFTLLFWKKEDEIYKGIQSSFTLKITDFFHFDKQINLLVFELLNSEFKYFNYAGITDIYVSELDGLGNYLGRTSYYNYKAISSAKKLLLSEENIIETIVNQSSAARFNVGFVYFNQDREGKKFNSTFIIYTQYSTVQSSKELINLANSRDFKQKIIKFAVENLYLDDLTVIGISDLYEIRNKGLFTLEGMFNDFENISSEIIPKELVQDKFNEVLDDYKYIDD